MAHLQEELRQDFRDTTEKMRRWGNATRDLDDDKLSYFKCLDIRFWTAFLEYMKKNRQTANGLRDWDNWKGGWPMDVSLDSAVRHLVDLWTQYQEAEESEDLAINAEAFEDAIMGVVFNMMALWREFQS